MSVFFKNSNSTRRGKEFGEGCFHINAQTLTQSLSLSLHSSHRPSPVWFSQRRYNSLLQGWAGRAPGSNCSIVVVQTLSPTLWPQELQHARLPYPSLSAYACSNSGSLSQWCHPTISSSVIPFSSCLQSFPASGSFPTSWLFASDGQSIGASASASVLSMNIQGWFPLRLIDLLAVQGPLKSLLQHHSSKASILLCSAFFMVQLSHPYMTPGKIVHRFFFTPIPCTPRLPCQFRFVFWTFQDSASILPNLWPSLHLPPLRILDFCAPYILCNSGHERTRLGPLAAGTEMGPEPAGHYGMLFLPSVIPLGPWPPFSPRYMSFPVAYWDLGVYFWWLLWAYTVPQLCNHQWQRRKVSSLLSAFGQMNFKAELFGPSGLSSEEQTFLSLITPSASSVGPGQVHRQLSWHACVQVASAVSDSLQLYGL